jgi:D-glycero-alpha-D-manno-heptose-7-phosphate kinase
MSPATITASAPSRIDLAGGTLDIWPISMLVPGAVTVNLAIELRATVQLERRQDGRLRIVSKDLRRQATRRLPFTAHQADGPLALLQRLAAAFDISSGLTMTSNASAPAGAGLGGSSTLAIAAAAALNSFTGAGLGRRRLLRRAMNVETVELGVPTGNQDYLAALHGGLAAYHHEFDGTRRELLRAPQELAERLVLAYTGQPRQSGLSNWEMFRRFMEGERSALRGMEAVAEIARELTAALRRGDLDSAGRLLGKEGRLRYRLAPSVATPALLEAGEAAAKAGALGSKVCGAGGGGCLVAFARSGRAKDVARAMAATGASILKVRIARRGVLVSAPRPGS